ncbi:MAG: helix-turn-helix transcriptional regulator [Clostridia bacterium]|nr:helix-turn-helix transcriptional regulator [Clostridia bacterium]
MNEKYFVGKNIKVLRDKFDLSQEQLADKLNVSSQAVSKWETGESYPSIDTLVRMSRLFCTSVDSMVTDVQTYEELDTNGNAVNFKMRQVFFRYHRGESITGELNDIIAIMLPLCAEARDYFWIYAARVIVKATLYAMLEDKNMTEDKFNIAGIKEVLQFSNCDQADKRAKISAYFEDKSKKCKELINVYLGEAQATASSIMSQVVVYINMLTY